MIRRVIDYFDWNLTMITIAVKHHFIFCFCGVSISLLPMMWSEK